MKARRLGSMQAESRLRAELGVAEADFRQQPMG